MKKLLTLLLVSICCSFSSYAQNEASNWYFGNELGLNVSNPNPIVLTGGLTGTGSGSELQEGTSVLSDKNGVLLFYTDGVSVYDGSTTIATDLAGGHSSSQAALIVPKPKHPELYYIFTSDDFQDTLKKGVCYSTINVCSKTLEEKNIQIVPNGVEKLTACRHANGKDYWVVSHDYGNTFYVFLVDETGVHPHAPQTIGSDHSIPSLHPGDLPVSAQGCMKLSPDGQLLGVAVGNRTDTYVELFEFDNLSGQLSHPFKFQPESSGALRNYYGIEFDNTSSFLYISDTQGKIWKYNALSAAIDTTVFITSKTLIKEAAIGTGFGPLQLTPSGEIYVVNDPSVIGSIDNNSVFHDSVVVFTEPKALYWSLPNFVAGFNYNKEDIVCTTSIEEIPGNSINGNTEFLVYTITGQLLGNSNYTLQGFTPGIYILHDTQNNKTIKKVVY